MSKLSCGKYCVSANEEIRVLLEDEIAILRSDF